MAVYSETKKSLIDLLGKGWSLESIGDYTTASIKTLEDTFKRNASKQGSALSGTKTINIEYLSYLTEKLGETNLPYTPQMLDEIEIISGETVKVFLHNTPKAEKKLVLELIDKAIDSVQKDYLYIDHVKEFENRFKVAIGKEGFEKASKENPDYLVMFINYAEVSPYTKAQALSALSALENEFYLSEFLSRRVDPSSYIREVAYKGLYMYWDKYYLEEENKFEYFRKMFKEVFVDESESDGVKATVKELLFLMDEY